MMISYDIYRFHYYSLEGLLNKLLGFNISIKKYFIYSKYDFYLKIPRKYRKVIRDNFNDFKIEDKIGCINFIEKLILKPSILVSLILSVFIFFNLSNRIYLISIEGDYPLIEEELRSYLYENNIKIYSLGINQNKIEEMEVLLKNKFNDELESIELTKNGATLDLKYKKRRKKIKIEDKKGSLYATKDGVIKGFSLSSGIKNVKIYDFVKKGDLLISDILITSSNENIVIGTMGKVFASTFYYIEVSCLLDLDDASKQAYLLDKARYEVSKNINSNDEYIDTEKILVNDLENGYMKIYYVLYEDITI